MQDGGGGGGGWVDLDQQPLSGQSWERDPGLLTPALSLDLHSNCRQGTELKTWAMWLPAGGRGICLYYSSFVGKGLWAREEKLSMKLKMAGKIQGSALF